MNLIWPITYVLISIVSVPEGTLEMSFPSFLILPLGKKGPGGWRDQAHGAAHRSTGQRTRLPDPWPSAWAIKRGENDKNWCFIFLRNISLIVEFCFIFSFGCKKKKLLWTDTEIHLLVIILVSQWRKIQEMSTAQHSSALWVIHSSNNYGVPWPWDLVVNLEVPAVTECISWLRGRMGRRKTNKEMSHLLLGGGEPH